MSSSRKNWTTLSSLAQQWSVEDEEEQERERRRRHRQLSSSSEAKEEESSSTGHNATSQTSNRFHSSSETKQLHLENSKLKNEKAQEDAIHNLEGRRVRKRAEFFNNWKQEKKTPVGIRKFEKEPAKENPVFPSESSKEKLIVGKCEKEIQRKDLIEEHNQIQSQKKETITLQRYESLNHEKDLKTDIGQVYSEKQKTPNACDSQRLAVVQNEVVTQQAQRASCERKSISRLEVKIQPRARQFTEEATATPASETPQATERTIPKTDAKTVRSPLGQDEPEAPVIISQPQITYSSSFNRITPRTISFRVISRKDRHEDTLSRSASMRLPGSTAKLEEKLEKYTSAVQRAGSIKVSPSVRRNYQLPSEGVASKRSIFEATVPVRNEPPTLIRKESLKIPGRVSSRINLWISQAQEPSKNEKAKDTQETGNTTEQSQCGK